MLDNAEENRGEADQTTGARPYMMGRNMFGPLRGEWAVGPESVTAVGSLTTGEPEILERNPRGGVGSRHRCS